MILETTTVNMKYETKNTALLVPKNKYVNLCRSPKRHQMASQCESLSMDKIRYPRRTRG